MGEVARGPSADPERQTGRSFSVLVASRLAEETTARQAGPLRGRTGDTRPRRAAAPSRWLPWEATGEAG